MIVMVDQVKLDYWKRRLASAKLDNERTPTDIVIVPDTLAWFIETIEFLQKEKP